jgi:hypothetical protein
MSWSRPHSGIFYAAVVDRRRALPVLALALAGVVATGCDSAEHAGAAATVGSTRIPLETVRNVSDVVYTGQFAQSTSLATVQRTVVDRLVSRQLSIELANRLGIPRPTKEQVDAAYQLDAQRQGGEDAFRQLAASQGYAGDELLAEIEKELLDQSIEAQLVKANPPSEAELRALYTKYQDQLQGATYEEAAPQLAQLVYAPSLLLKEQQKLADEIGVHVNTRFGTWSASQGQVVDDLAPLSSPGLTGGAAPGTVPVQ